MQRLKTRPQFQAALAGGTVSRTSHFALHRLSLTPAAPLAPVQQTNTNGPAPSAEQALFGLVGPWMGAMVPKRWAKRAVTRNCIKRQAFNVGKDF